MKKNKKVLIKALIEEKLFLLLSKACIGNISMNFLSISFSFINSELNIQFCVSENDEETKEYIEDIIVDLEVQVNSMKQYSNLGHELDHKWKIQIVKTVNKKDLNNLDNIIYLISD